MENEELLDTHLLNMDVDVSVEFAVGFGLKQVKHLLFLSLPIVLVIWFFPIHHTSKPIDLILRVFTIVLIVGMLFLLVRLKRLKGTDMTDFSILDEDIRYRWRKRQGRNKIPYNKFR